MRLVASEFASLDGVIEDPAGSEQFEHGGWTNPYWGDELLKFEGDEPGATTGYLPVNGLEMYYEIHGGGPRWFCCTAPWGRSTVVLISARQAFPFDRGASG